MSETTIPAGVSKTEHMVSVLMARIDAGVYPIGESMPSERELMAEFGVSRVTVRNVLERLESEALIERKASRGTFVRPKRVASRARDPLRGPRRAG